MRDLVLGALASSFFLSFASTAVAECVGPVVQGQCLSGTSVRGYGSDPGYQGSSGSRYQYDLKNPVDSNRYSIDLDAQRRDRQEGIYDAGRNLDQLRGQYGGGYQGR